MTGSTRSCGTTAIMRAGGGDGIPALRAGGHFVTEEARSDQMREIIFEVTEAPSPCALEPWAREASSAEGRPDT